MNLIQYFLMQKTCTQCSATFEITDADLRFYEKVSPAFSGKKYSISPPKQCPECRFRERLIWRPELHLHQRTSDKTGNSILSMFAPEAPCVVYEPQEWWKDDWDPLEYGREFDFSRPFFEQFAELLRVTPLIALSEGGNVNSDYINSASWNKNCYLLAGANHNEDCYYGNFVNYSSDCLDCSFIDHCQWCYECIDCTHCHTLRYSQNCSNCSDSFFLFNCRGCRNCFGLVNLIEKEYVWMNQQLSKEEYNQRLEQAQLHRGSRLQEAAAYFETHRLTYPHKHMIGEMNQNVTGNAVFRSKNARDCFDVSDVEDCTYCSWFHKSKSCMDCYSWGFDTEECYQCLEVGDSSRRVHFSSLTYNGNNYLYCYLCRNSSNLLGCVSLRRKEYCILNKQYSKEEYELLAAKILDHMIETGEWGEFFPMSTCPIAYNQAICQDYFPLTKQQAEALGARWHDEKPPKKPAETVEIPDTVAEVDPAICDQLLTCRSTGKPYKVISRELAFYKRMNIPVPRQHFYARHMERLQKRNPRHLWVWQCAQCSKTMQTSYSPQSPEKVLCEDCYLKEVY